MPPFEHHIFVCTNDRGEKAPRPSCANEGGKKLKGAFKDAIKAAGLKKRIRVNETGCLDQCEHAAVCVIYPEQVWYGFTHARDCEEIVKEHLLHGRPVARLRLPDSCVNSSSCPHRKK